MAAKLANYSRSDIFMVPPEDIIIVGLDPLDDSSTSGRPPSNRPMPSLEELCEPESNALPVDDTMVRSIMHYGVLEPVIIRKIDEKPYCVVGRGRIRAAREANARLFERGEPEIKVPCIIRRGEDGQFAGVVIAENEIRKITDPLTKARALKRFLDRGNTEDDAAVAFGKSKATIMAWLTLLDVAPEVQAKVESGEITAHAALVVSELPKADQGAAVELAQEAAVAKGRKRASGTAVRKAVKALKGDGDVETAVKAPGKALLRKLHEASVAEVQATDGAISLAPMARFFLRWVATGEGAKDVPGLETLLGRVGEE